MNIRSYLRRRLYQLANLQDTYHRFKYKYYVKHIPSKETIQKVQEMRKKDKIKVAFIVYNIPKWKSERLYLAMKEHPRFDPIIVPILHQQTDYLHATRDFQQCIDILNKKGYSYVIGTKYKTIDELVAPDIVFYGEPFCNLYDNGYTVNYDTHRKSLSCDIHYCFKNTCLTVTTNTPQTNLIWMNFYENESVVNDLRKLLANKAKNCIPTGIPFQDSLLSAFSNPKDVWKPQDKKKKRIIWAPSYSMPNSGWNVYQQSTFLDIADYMIQLAEKYSDKVQFAFKPHPLLRPRLDQMWGVERTNAYYQKWADMENTQLEEGQYIDLFMTSDAMMHDCMSFMVEYMFSENPVVFLDNGKKHDAIFNEQTKKAYDLHYKVKPGDEIEKFIVSTILEGNDSLKKERLEYKKDYLMPPYGKPACQNIINAILGEEEFADK